MINRTIKHYKITEKLGEGGMGVVYKAHDTKLDRTVALKFLPLSLSSSDDRNKRFLNEARAASALQHSNTCTIHEIDETPDGQLYIVMPAYEGKSLDQIIQQDELDLEQIINIAIQIGEGLKAAHDHGIIHRDIKSSNILITDEGQAVIMDFGLAQKDDTSQLTKTGQAIGTVPYMSPEQARGDEVDHRTDMWSLGVVLYEILTGKNPFPSEYPQAVIYSIINEEPEYVTRVRSDIPDKLGPVVHKALEKNKEDRYQNADALLKDLKEIQDDIRGHTGHRKTFKTKSILKNRIFSPVPATTFLVLVIAAISSLLFRPSEKVVFEEQDWVMITDFENQTNEEVFSQILNTILEVGIYQSTFVNLYERNQTLNILGNELQIKDVKTLTPEVVRKAAEAKDVNVLLLPKIQHRDDSYLLSAQIWDIQSNTTVDIEPVEAAGKDEVLQAMDALSKRIRLRLGEPSSNISDEYTPISQATTSSLEALKLYAEGMKIKQFDKATGYDLITQAVEIDPEFALAHAELGMHHYIDGNRKVGEKHYQKALALMDRLTLRERLWIRAIVADWRGNREKAIENYKSYLTQFPDDYSAWWRLGYTYLITQNYDDCIDSYSRVVEFEPQESSALVNIATCYNSLGENEQALENYRKAFQIRPDMKKGQYINNEYGFLLVKMGNPEEARETFELMLSDKETKARGLRSLALLNTYTGNFSKAIGQFKEAVLLNKSFGWKLSELRDRMYLARAYRAKGMNEEFVQQIEEIDRLVNEMDLSPSWLADVGKLYARHGMIDMAGRVLAKIKENIGDVVAASGVNRNISKDQAFYYLVNGEIELTRGNHEEAIESLKIANNITDLPESLARGYLRSGNLDSSIEFYREVIEDNTISNEHQLRWILAHYHLGRTYEEQGKINDAIKYYQQFIEIWKNGDEDLVALKDARERLKKRNEPSG